MKKLVAILALCLVCALSAVGFIACGVDETADTRDPQILGIYNTYVAYAEENGKTPLPYEEWLAFIKGEKGQDGVGIAHVEIDNNGNLIIALTNGNNINAGKVINNDEDPQGLDFYLLPDDTYGVGGGTAYFLEEIIIPSTYRGKAITKIVGNTGSGHAGFEHFENLKSITIPDSITGIEEYAFYKCGNLAGITFMGTKNQWKEIDKHNEWCHSLPAAVVHCSDGDVEISEILNDIGIENPVVALIALHDETSTYDKNFIDAFKAACDVKNVNPVIISNISEDNDCYRAASAFAINGCKAVFADSFGHEVYLLKAAKEFSDTQFFHATGTRAHTEGLDNYYNAFADIYQGRYLTGYAAGLKLLTMKDKAVNNNFKIGYVSCFPYAECISAQTAFYLGVKAAINENDSAYTVSMEVRYTGSWYDPRAEQVAAEMLISGGCVLLSQHSDSMGVPEVCEMFNVPNVAYNFNTGTSTMVAYCKINWQPYFEKMIDCVLNGADMTVDYSGTLQDNSVQWYLGANIADGTLNKVKAVETELVNGTRKVFDCSTFTVNGANITSYLADVDDDGTFVGETNVIITDAETGITYFAESYYRSAPYFDIEIDGITTLGYAW